MLGSLRARARRIKADTFALYLAARDPRTPWYAKALGTVVVAYALSPIDLIPDFVPLLGYLDDLILVPLGILLTVRLIPAPVMADCRERARISLDRPTSRWTVVIIVAIWILLTAMVVLALLKGGKVI